MNIEDLINI